MLREEQDNICAFIDRAGAVVLKPRFIRVSDFSEGLAEILVSEASRGYINEAGVAAIGPESWYDTSPFSDGLALITLPRAGGFQFIDRAGRVVIKDPRFSGFHSAFRNGRTAARVGDKWGWIDRAGRFLIEPQFDECGGFREGLAWVRRGTEWLVIDEEGGVVSRLEGRSWLSYSEGLLGVKTEGRFGYVDRSGAFAVPPQFDHGGGHTEGLAWVCAKGKFGYINRSGTFVIAPRYDDANEFADGRARVKVGDKYGFIDRSGQEVIPVIYASAGNAYRDGLVRVVLGQPYDQKDQYLDRDGKVVWEGKHWTDFF